MIARRRRRGLYDRGGAVPRGTGDSAQGELFHVEQGTALRGGSSATHARGVKRDPWVIVNPPPLPGDQPDYAPC